VLVERSTYTVDLSTTKPDMFSLIITIVAIALVVALAVAVIYYGGDTSSRAMVRSSSNTLLNQASQINAAGTMAVANGAGWPAEAPIFAEPYLKAMPVPPRSAYVAGIEPAASDWEYYLSDKSAHHFVLRDKINREVCLAINKEMGVEGIPAAWDGTTLIQCYGTGTVVEGAYTFFFDPPSSTPSENTAVLAQSLTEGGTVIPGYPRLCADGSTISEGLCSPNGNAPAPIDGTGGGAGGVGASNPPAGTGMDGMSWDYDAAPDEQTCLADPTIPQCDVSKYPALRVDNFTNYGDMKFTAIKDCSLAAGQGYVCIPRFNSLSRTWSWTPPDSISLHTQEDSRDGRLAWRETYSYGFTISDGVNEWTVSQYNQIGYDYLYVDIIQYQTFVSPTRGPALAVDCTAIQADLATKGGYFLSDSSCYRIETGAQYTWNLLYTNASVPRMQEMLKANPGWTHDEQSWGPIDYADTDWLHDAIHAPSGLGEHAFIIGAIPLDKASSPPVDVSGGAKGNWPSAPLVTTLQALQY
jgi:hypothetical protein